LNPKPATPEAFKLMLEGSQALARMEANGMRVDIAYLDKMLAQTADKLQELHAKLKQDEIWRVWQKQYGAKADLDSPDQLGNIIFNIMGILPSRRTATGKPATDEAALELVDLPFLRTLLNIRKLGKVRSTYLQSWRLKAVNGILHPTFNLHVVITFRSSGSDPNVQNVPVRNPKTAKLIRPAIIPRDENYLILEVDNSGAEVRCSACYHKDPTMLRYIDEGYDYHREMAAECYLLDAADPKGVPKACRQEAKGKFVFAEFYGDWYKSVCQNLWAAAAGLTTPAGLPMYEHLANQGIYELGDCDPKARNNPRHGTFEAHIKQVEHRFWYERLPVYTQWKNLWWEEYLRNGWLQMLTGFVCQGIYGRNDVINYPVQGSSFHCTLWAIIEMQKWLDQYKMRTMIIGQIHDSIILDVHKDELEDVKFALQRIMTRDIRKAWPWLICPLEVEMEASPISWHHKEPLKLEAI
jgi:DNA polymerase-1